MTFDVAGATSGRFPPTEARIELEVKQRACEARVRITRKARPLLALQASLELPVAAARDPAALAAAPLRVRAVVGPLAMQRLGLPPETDRAPPRAFNGRLHADVSIDGTLRAPTGVVHVQVDDVKLDKTFVGYGRLEASYGDRQAKLDARLTTQNGGTLHATSATKIDLGYPGVTRPLDVRKLPLDVRIDAKDFDLRGFSGATDDLRTVAGLLTASATVSGTVADPKIAGRIDWRDGVVAITGLGQYERIHLALHGDANRVVVDELVASSGAGKARVTGDGTRSAAGKGYEIALQSDLQRFPIYKQGQPLANVSLESKLKGRVAPFDTRVALDIADARVELADAERKSLQRLEAPADVVLVEGDRPLNRAQEKKLRALTGVRRRRCAAGRRPATGTQPAHEGERTAQVMGQRQGRQPRARSRPRLPYPGQRPDACLRPGHRPSRPHRRVRTALRSESGFDADLERSARSPGGQRPRRTRQ